MYLSVVPLMKNKIMIQRRWNDVGGESLSNSMGWGQLPKWSNTARPFTLMQSRRSHQHLKAKFDFVARVTRGFLSEQQCFQSNTDTHKHTHTYK